MNRCARCAEFASITDVLGYAWCVTHAYRAEVSAWGKAHHFPDLKCFPFAIGPGEYLWKIAVGVGKDDFLYMALAAIEDRENNEDL